MYSRVLGKRLADFVRDAQGQTQSALALRDELAIMRAFAMESLEQYENICAQLEHNQDISVEQRARVTNAAAAVAKHALVDVRDMALAASRVEREIGLDLGAVQSVLLQVVQLFDERVVEVADKLESVGIDPQSFVDTFADRVMNEVRVIPRGALPQTEQPSKVLEAMNYTVVGDDDASLRAVS